MSFPFTFPPEAFRPPTSQRHTDDLLVAPQTTYRSSRTNPSDGAATPAEYGIEAVPTSSIPRKNIVFPDPVAFRYLQDEPCAIVSERRTSLRGYELYLVEQWACSRQSPTLVIVTYTGDESHSVVVGVLSVPVDESLWSKNLRAYFKVTRQYLARPKETDLGELMVTNLSSFPSALTVIHVPDGDIRKHKQAFIVNENLKRLGCSGRSGLTINEPNEGTQVKFQSLYKVSDRIPFCAGVMELIKLCQVALYLFDKLEPEYIDGLLCDVTENAIGNWWTEVGAEHFNFEPNDGILGPTTVAALLGMLMGSRNRLYYYGAPVSKDAFDLESTSRGIVYFQKSLKLKRTKKLDRQTLRELHNATAKAAAGEGWGVQKAVKSRMTEIGGKRGEIVMGMVSGKDKGGLADVETLDIERFISFAYGERAKWLWFGKPRRTMLDAPNPDNDAATLSVVKDDGTGQPISRAQTAPTDDEGDAVRKDGLHAVYSELPPSSTTSISESPGDKDALRRNVLKSVAGKMSDARSGLGRIKDAVGGGRRGHGSRPSLSLREDMMEQRSGRATYPITGDTMASTPVLTGPGRAFTWKNKPEEYLSTMRRGENLDLQHGRVESRDHSSSGAESRLGKKQSDLEKELINIGSEIRKDAVTMAPSTAASVVDDNDLQGPLLEAERKRDSPTLGLSRRHSLEVAQLALKHVFNEDRWPRRLSFSDAEEAVLTWEEVIDLSENAEELSEIEALGEYARHLNHGIDDITFNVGPWVEEKLKAVALLDERFARDKDDLQNLYHQLDEACRRVRYNSDELLAGERASLTESVKEIEVLIARLEYEINALAQKAADVEDGIQTFERQVEDVEERANALKIQLETESWLHWFVRTMTGVGTGPNITRERS